MGTLYKQIKEMEVGEGQSITSSMCLSDSYRRCFDVHGGFVSVTNICTIVVPTVIDA